ncbi:MAG: 4-hydroxy-3-methylbut-2-enyl diphosphate reductase [Bacteroidetes bacterium]|nr:4-hydroxy-3-methylbut-2-enyl diphosphate reductase [Bacteroidota bacterium]
MKQFDVPVFYRSPLISAIKKYRKAQDKLKKDFTPTRLDFGPLQIHLARHFGFCYGVENAIEIAFRTIDQNPGKRIFLLSEMIHNPHVNEDLLSHGIRFLQDTHGNVIIPFDTLTNDDIVIIPAFGTTLKIQDLLLKKGIDVLNYNTTCPFVERVWNKAEQIAQKGYSIIIHGKPRHEETRATFSHSAAGAPSVIVKDMEEAICLGKYITGESNLADFEEEFKGKFSEGFDPEKNLRRIGIVNQTTMLASDTQAIADYFKALMISHYQLTDQTIAEHFADTRDTLCYATNDNQTSVSGMLEANADIAIVVGGYNSSNTSHLVELCEEHLPTYFIANENMILSRTEILHYDLHTKTEKLTSEYLPKKDIVSILLTSGASCPDAIVEKVIQKVSAFFGVSEKIGLLVKEFEK